MVASPELIIDGKSSQENVDKTQERVKSQVDKELQQLTSEIWKNFYSINEKWEVEYDLDLVKKYLETKKDKQYSELKTQNTSAWIMAVQIALSSVGYDVGKVDWILRNKWAKTSKTVAQIIKFQKDNWLKPDWQPGSKTITKLLEKLWPTTLQDWDIEKKQKEEWVDENVEGNNELIDNNVEENGEIITKEKFEELRFKTELSDKEVKQVVDYANKEWWSWLSLRIRTIKNKNQLEELSKIKSALHLSEIHSITNEQLKYLSNVEWLALNWLRKITLEQAKIVTSWKVKKLELEWLDWFWKGSMTDAVAYELSKLDELYVNSARLTQNQKQILKNLK